MEFDRDFTDKCKEHFGKSPTHIAYILVDVADKVKQIEDRLKEAMPVMGASILKMEIITDALHDKNVIHRDIINGKVDERISDMNKEII